MFDGKAFGKEIVDVVKAHVEKTVGPLLSQIEALRAEVDALKPKQIDPAEIDRKIEAFGESMKQEREAAKVEAKEKRKAAVADLKAGILAECETMVSVKVADMVAAAVEAIKPELGELVADAVDALPPAENGKDADPVEVAALVAQEAERILAGWERPKDGIDGKSVTLEDISILAETMISKRYEEFIRDMPVPKDGRDGFDGVEFLRNADGHLLVTMSNGTVRDLGEIVGKDGRDGKDADMAAIESKLAAIPEAPDVDLSVVTRMIEDAVAKHTVEPMDFAPDDVAINVALAVKMMAETPQTQARQEAPTFNVYSNVTTPEMKAADTVVNVTVPEQAAPVVNIDAPVNVAPPNVIIEAKRTKERTTVTGWDKSGRISEFEKTEVDE